MILGDNGSGKSTILSQLHPLKDSFDERKELILPGTEGRKEIDIEHNGSLYTIQHIFAEKKTSSFIQKDGVELNNDGAVRKFEEIVRNELGMNKEYFSIARIGNNTKHFINFSTTERKECISTFVEDVDKYIQKYSVVSGKFKADTDKIKEIAANIKRFPEEDKLSSLLESDKEKLSKTEENIISVSNNIAVSTSKVNEIDSKFNEIEYNNLTTAKADLTKKKYELSSRMTVLESKYPRDSEFFTNIDKIDDYRAKVVKDTSAHAVTETELNIAKTHSVDIQNNILKIKLKLNSIERGDLSVINKEIKELEVNKKELEDKISKSPLIAYCSEDKDIKNIPIMISKYYSFMMFLTQNFIDLNSKDIEPTVPNIKVFFKTNFQESFKRQLLYTRDTIAQTEELRNKANNDLGVKYSNLNKLDILKKRPVECHIDGCPFIRDALQYKNLPEEIATLEESLKSIESNIKNLTVEADRLNDIRVLYKNLLLYFKDLNPKENIVYEYACKTYGNISAIISEKPEMEVVRIANDVKLLFEEYIEDISNLNNINSTLENRNTSKALIKNSEDVATHYDAELQKLEKESAAKLSELNDLVRDMEEYLFAKNNYVTVSDELDKITSSVQAADNLLAEKIELSNSIKLNTTDLNVLNTEKGRLTKEISDTEFSIRTLDDLNKKMKELRVTYGNLKIVKEALDPKSGIPLIFIQAYLGKTEVIANEFLNLAFDGKFEIKFISGPKDFFIQVRTGNNIKSDIKLASQGEISLTTISISLALIEQSLGDFNILALDEIDGPLDSNNRESFINILNAQVQKLGIEQTFVISHNNAFDTVPMNLILLKGAEERLTPAFLSNKNIIFNVNE